MRGSPWQSSGSDSGLSLRVQSLGRELRSLNLGGEPHPPKEGENPLPVKVVELEMGALGAWAGSKDPGRRRGREGRRRGCQRPTGKGLVPIPGRALDLVRLALALNGNLTLGALVCSWQK